MKDEIAGQADFRLPGTGTQVVFDCSYQLRGNEN
jgi:hypothetical protein